MNTWMRPWRASDAHLPLADARSFVERTFRHADVPSVRRFAVEFGARAGIKTARLADWVLAVNEAVACAVARGASTGRLRLWTTGPRAFCSVSGDILAPQGPGGGRQGDVDALRRWLLNRLCDYVSVESGPDGVRVLLSISVT
jgi:hypothetical protein